MARAKESKIRRRSLLRSGSVNRALKRPQSLLVSRLSPEHCQGGSRFSEQHMIDAVGQLMSP
jgi:hypothetical protein